MSLALLGSIGLQIYWINYSVNLNEAQFDKNAFIALRHVAERLERDENTKIARISDFVLRNKEDNQNSKIKLNEEEIVNWGFDPSIVMAFDSTYHSTEDYMATRDSQFKYMRSHSMLKTVLAQQLFGQKPVEDRIVPEELQISLQQELKNVGLSNIKFQSGVYSAQINGFVIKDDHFYIEPTTATADAVNASQFDYLANTRYRVDLFSTQDIQSPGQLVVHFENKTGYIWSSVWKILMASVIFSAITLFCFAYTISIVFRQKKLDEIKNDFINNMTHEFKTPIATISLAADSINNPTILEKPERVKKFIDIIKQENKRMNGQVEKVLQMAIIDKEKFKIKLSEVDIHEVVEGAVMNFAIQVEARDGQVEADLKAERSIVEGDFTHISNIIHNLMDNANKYSPDAPHITVRTANLSSGIEIRVEDKGMGLSPAARKQIFDKFYRVPTGNVHDVKGFGLGLSYVKTMVTAHKGTIDVKSELGKGSTFIVFFPFSHGEK